MEVTNHWEDRPLSSMMRAGGKEDERQCATRGEGTRRRQEEVETVFFNMFFPLPSTDFRKSH